jgi:hypothetical protein
MVPHQPKDFLKVCPGREVNPESYFIFFIYFLSLYHLAEVAPPSSKHLEEKELLMKDEKEKK